MTPQQKVALVEGVWKEYGLAESLEAIELSKSTWYYHRRYETTYEKKHEHLRSELEEIAREHPGYGYRRTTAELRESYGHKINHKVVQRLHRLWGLPLLRSIRPPKPSGVREAIIAAGERVNPSGLSPFALLRASSQGRSLVAQLKEIGLFEVVYTDFTELAFADGSRKAYLIPIIGHNCKMAWGWALGEVDDTPLALEAWKMAKATFRKYGISYEGMIIHHDQDSVFTSHSWAGQLLLRDNVRLSYALRGARDNPQMESFFSRFKAEGNSLFLDAKNITELGDVVDSQMRYYNTKRRHSSLGYLSPLRYIERMRSGRKGAS